MASSEAASAGGSGGASGIPGIAGIGGGGDAVAASSAGGGGGAFHSQPEPGPTSLCRWYSQSPIMATASSSVSASPEDSTCCLAQARCAPGKTDAVSSAGAPRLASAAPPKSSGPLGGDASYPSSSKSVLYISTMRRIVSGRTSAHVHVCAEVAFEVFEVDFEAFEVSRREDVAFEDAFFEVFEVDFEAFEEVSRCEDACFEAFGAFFEALELER